MSLLDDEGDPFEIDPGDVEHGSSPRMDGEEGYHLHRPKRDRRVKVSEKGLSLRRSKPREKDGSLEKTPRRGKHARSKSGSRSPPDSPKATRTLDGGKKAGKAGTTQLQPSPNVRSTRKCYSQLGEAASSSETEETLPDTLLSNQASGEMEPLQDLPPSPPTPTVFSGDPQPGLKVFSPTRRTTVQFPVSFAPKQCDIQDKTGRVSIDIPLFFQGVVPQDLGSPVRVPPIQPLQFFQSPLPPQPLQSAPLLLPNTSGQPDISPAPTPPSGPNPVPEGEWILSDELKQKCHTQFAELYPSGGLLQGDKARVFFQQSKLPNQELSQIWRLADIDQDNALSEHEFTVAMKLVLVRRRGYDIPSSLPDALRGPPRKDPFSDSFLPPHPQSHPPPSRPPPPSVLASKGAGEPSRVVRAQVPQKPAPDISGEEVVQDTKTETGDSRPHEVSQQATGPRVGRIISIEGDSAEEEEEGDESAALVQLGTRRRTESDSSLHEKERLADVRPARPAPPRPTVRRAKSLKQPPSVPNEDVPNTEAGSSGYTPVIKVQKSLPSASSGKLSRPTTLGPTGERYRTLASANSSSGSSPASGEREEVDSGKFGWLQLQNSAEECESSLVETQKRGHARSTSLDLNKMLQGDGSASVQEDRHYKDLPSAVPPKPPPKPLSYRLANTDDEEEGEKAHVKRGRSASTGSISERRSATPEEDSSRLITHKDPPPTKPRPPKKVPVLPPHPKPKRPAPVKPSRQETEPDSKHTSKDESHLLLRDKGELQLNIRSLKETHAALSAINRELEETLFKLMEERVQLSRQLELAQHQL